MTSRAQVYAAIDSERDYQEMRKKRDQGSPFHSVEEFILFMDYYLTETKKIASTTWGPEAKLKTLEFVRKVTALGVACMEENGAPQREKFERNTEYMIVQLPNMAVAGETEATKLIVAFEAINSLPEGYFGQQRHETRHGVAMSDVREDILGTLRHHVNRLGK